MLGKPEHINPLQFASAAHSITTTSQANPEKIDTRWTIPPAFRLFKLSSSHFKDNGDKTRSASSSSDTP